MTLPGCARVKAKDTFTVLERGPSASTRTRAAKTTISSSGSRRSARSSPATSFSDFGDGLDIWIGDRKHVTRDDVVQRLRPLLGTRSSWCCPHTASRRIARRSSTCSREPCRQDQRLRRRGAFLGQCS